MTGPQRSFSVHVRLLSIRAGDSYVVHKYVCVCVCHRYLLHRLGRLRPELAEFPWSGPLRTQLQHTRHEKQIRACVRA